MFAALQRLLRKQPVATFDKACAGAYTALRVRYSTNAASWNEGGIQHLFENNRKWSAQMKSEDPEFFDRIASNQTPQYLWIGCADSRVPSSTILGLQPGEVFVQRNVGNQACHRDINCMACLEYAVNALKVKHVIVSGHYNCGAVKAALTLPSKQQGIVNHWISEIRQVRDEHVEELMDIENLDDKANRLAELNVMHQVFSVCTSPIVQAAWEMGQQLAVHGLIYTISEGIVKELTKPIDSIQDFEAYENELYSKFSMRAQNLAKLATLQT